MPAQDAVATSGVLGDYRHREAVFLVSRLNPVNKLFLFHRHFWHTNQVGCVSRPLPGQRRRGSQPSGVPPHDLNDGYRRGHAHRPGILARADSGQRDEPRGAAIPGGVVGQHQVVVDGLGHVHHPQFITGVLCRLADGQSGFSRVVAADDKQEANVVSGQCVQYRIDFIGLQLVSGGAQRRRRSRGDSFPLRLGHCSQFDQLVRQDALQAVNRPPNLVYARLF